MDLFNHYTKYNNNNHESKCKKVRKIKRKMKRDNNNNGPLKIVYISSPMKVKTSECKFRSLVQELTGKDSQVAMFMEISGQLQECVGSGSDSRSSEEAVGMSSDQALLAHDVVEEELGMVMMNGCTLDELEFPWHLLNE